MLFFARRINLKISYHSVVAIAVVFNFCYSESIYPRDTQVQWGARAISNERARVHLQKASGGHLQTQNLPIQTTRMLGREQEMATLRALIQQNDVRLVTLIGPGGIGKTRLGLEIANELLEVFDGNISFVSLATINDAELVIATIAQSLMLKETGELSLLDVLKALIRDIPMLVVLDSFEHVVVAAPRLSELLIACQNLKFLVTSRVALHIRDEHQFPVLPLALPSLNDLTKEALSQYAATALFLERAKLVKPDFQITAANTRAIANICARLDGLPLAIELAAAWMKLLTPQALLPRLEHRLAVLTGGARDVPTRQQTLRNTIAWSYNLLSAAEQQCFRRLAVFARSWTIEAAEAVFAVLDVSNDNAGLLNSVNVLLDSSLLYRADAREEESRFAMLEVIREFALEALAENRELNNLQEAHSTYYLDLVTTSLEQPAEVRQGLWIDRIEKELDNLRAALQHTLEKMEKKHDSAIALQIGGILTPFWLLGGYWSEGLAFLERALMYPEGVEKPVLAKGLLSAGKLAFQVGNYQRAEEMARESQLMFEELRDPQGIASTLEILGMVTWNSGDLSNARSLLEEALILYQQVSDEEGIVNSFFALAWLARAQGDYERARMLCDESLAFSSNIGLLRGIADADFLKAQIFFDTQADQLLAYQHVESVLELYRQVFDREGVAACFHLLGQITLSQGDAEKARSWFERSVEQHRELGHMAGMVWSMAGIGRVDLIRGDLLEAYTKYEESLSLARALGDQELLVNCMEGFAEVVSMQGKHAWAAQIWGAAAVLRDSIGQPHAPVERVLYDNAIKAVRHHLGEQVFLTAYERGRSMSPDRALLEQAPIVLPPPTTPSQTTKAIQKSNPDGLTPREVEVLRQVAQGMTNEQVANQLIISPRTVDTHLTSIYGKIGVSSRSAATRYAIEHQLI